MQLLAIDPGMHTGWAVASARGIEVAYESGTFELKKKNSFEGAGMPLLRFRHWLDRRLPLDELVFEFARFQRGGIAAQVYGNITGVLMEWCELHSIPYSTVQTGALKKWATGWGDASKEDMVAKACTYFGETFAPEQHNEVDALWMAAMALKQPQPKPMAREKMVAYAKRQERKKSKKRER